MHGTGGSLRDTPSFGRKDPPGAGVVGQGGREDGGSNIPRFSHGAGVIAVAGGSGKPIPPQAVTGGVGVYAQGAEAKVFTDLPISRPIAPGPGVLGRGGLPIPGDADAEHAPVAAGVIGLAGDTAIPSISESGNSGVYGAGPIGVRGQGGGVDVSGTDFKAVVGYGGYFASQEVAQIHLEPSPKALPDPNGLIDGRTGDLLVLQIHPLRDLASLWFCRFTGKSGWVKLA